MKYKELIMIVEDEPLASISLARNLKNWGYEVIPASNGREALELFVNNSVSLILVDWMMPVMNGLELCEKLRTLNLGRYLYIIFLTGKIDTRDTITALEAGADDYLNKPFHPDELKARIRAGERVLKLERELRKKNQVLEEMLNKLEKSHHTIKQLKNIVPICMYCKKIRNDDDYWQQLEIYMHNTSDVDFSHSICPECVKVHHGNQAEN